MDNNKENNKEQKVCVFEGREIRSVWDDEEHKRLYSIVDVCGALTDSENPRKYWSKLRQRLASDSGQPETNCLQLDTSCLQLMTNCQQLKLLSEDGKMRLTDVADARQLLEIIEFIPSRRTGPFRKWLSETEGKPDDTEPLISHLVRMNGTHEHVRRVGLDNDPDMKNLIRVPQNSKGDIVIYRTDDEPLEFEVLIADETVWLSQVQMS